MLHTKTKSKTLILYMNVYIVQNLSDFYDPNVNLHHPADHDIGLQHPNRNCTRTE